MTFEEAVERYLRKRKSSVSSIRLAGFTDGWNAATAEAEKRAKEREAAIRLDEAQWWEPRTVTHGLGWQHEECNKRIKAARSPEARSEE
jgi:hypothetical protein